MERAGPPYCEGYPRLIGSEVREAWACDEEARTLCRFTTRAGEVRGWLEVLPDDFDHGFAVRWKFYGPGLNSDVGRHMIHFTYTRGKVGRPTPFRCQKCKRQVGNLVFTRYWACGSCHGLRNRSTFLRPDVLRAERQAQRLLDLRQTIGGGRPRRMRQVTYRSLKAELARLEKAAGHDFPVACQDRLDVVVSEWMTEERARREHRYDPEVIFIDGTPRPAWS